MKKLIKKASCLRLVVAVLLCATVITGCGSDGSTKNVKLSKDDPVTIEIWHYYNGLQKDAFDKIVNTFNQTVGKEQGIIVEAFNSGNVNELATSVLESAQNKVGAKDVPNIFAAYADTVYKIDQIGLAVNLEEYLSEKEIDMFVGGYIEEGRMGNGLKILPVAKSTEVLTLNSTDWEPFSKETDTPLSELSSIERLVATAKKYYEWTDAKTPDVLNDGKAFFSRDAMANYMIIGSMQLGKEIFEVDESGNVKYNIDQTVIKKLWDNFYVPYINGYFQLKGKFAADDAKLGDVIAIVGSTTSVGFFPTEVVKDGKEPYPITPIIMQAPGFEGAKSYAVQQGAGMVVTKSTPEEEYASVEFLKWFTQKENNLLFSLQSYYLPVLKESAQMSALDEVFNERKADFSEITRQTLRVGYETVAGKQLYTNRAFEDGARARSIVDTSLINKAREDKTKIDELIASGTTREDAIKQFDSDENFQEWYSVFSNELKTLAKGS